MNVKKILNVKHPVSLVRYAGESVGVIDEKNTFRKYSIIDFKLLGGFKINLPPNKPLENSVAISPSGNYLAVAVTGKRKTTVWDINKKKLLHTLGWHKGDVLSISFDYEDSYMLTGGADGRAYLWSVSLGKMVATLPPHPDYILSSAFSRNNLWVATGSYDRMISITNISSLNISYRKKSHRGAVTQLKFLSSAKMISGDKTGELIVWDYVKGNIIKRLQGVADQVIDFTFDENEEYMFVITNEKKVYLYDLRNYELISDEFIKLNELPSSIDYVPENNTLWIGTLGGSVYIFDIYEDQVKLSEAILKKDFGLAYELVKTNPFLKRTELYKKLENDWERTLETAYRLMEKGEYEKAKQLLNPYLNIPSKRVFIQNLLRDFAEFEKFKTAVIKRKYPLAYSLANQYPSFKDTIYYKKMEEDWTKVFNKAKELIKIRGKEDVVKQLLAPFRGVSQKTPFIQALFNDKHLYDVVKSLLIKRKFGDFFKFLEKYPFLYGTSEYKQAMEYAKRLYEGAEEALKKGDYKKAFLYAQMLIEFPEYKDKAKEIIEKVNVTSNFLRIMASKNYDMIEKFVNSHPFLEESEDYQKLKEEIQRKFALAEKEALEGNVKNISTVLGDLINSEIYKNKIIQIIRSAYLNQLLNALKSKEFDKVKKGVKNYIAYFGTDNEIEDIIKIGKKLGVEFDINSFEPSKILSLHSLPHLIWEEE